MLIHTNSFPSMMMLFARSATKNAKSLLLRRGFAAAVGEKLPSVALHKGFPPEKVNLADYAADKSLVLVGLPGAFTPTIPNYKEHQDALRAEGIDEVIVWCVNDGAVMQGWAKDQRIGLSMLKLMGDPSGELTQALDVQLTDPGPAAVGIIGRCKRHAIYAVNGVIQAIHVAEAEGDPAGDKDPSVTLAPAMLEAIKKAKQS